MELAPKVAATLSAAALAFSMASAPITAAESTNAGIAYSITKTIGGDASYSLSWSIDQTIGPYKVPAGYTGRKASGIF